MRDTGARNYAKTYRFPDLTLSVDISLVTGNFEITQLVCSDTMHRILDDCGPYKKEAKANHLLKYGGGIPVTITDGTANFNISLTHSGASN